MWRGRARHVDEPPGFGLPHVAEAVQRRVLDGWVVVVGERDVDEGVKVVENLWVALDRETPGIVHVAAVVGLGPGKIGGRRWAVVMVEALCGDLVEVLRVSIFAGLGYEVEVGEDVVSGAATDPGPAQYGRGHVSTW